MSFKLHLILALKPSVFMQIRCNFPDISYLSETQKNNFQFLNEVMPHANMCFERVLNSLLLLQFVTQDNMLHV